MQSGVYEIVNLVNGKRYVGSAVNLSARHRDHLHRLRKGIHHSIALQRAWNKYGPQSFGMVRVIEKCEVSVLVDREQWWINFLRPEYNVCKVAGSSLGRKHTPETRQKMALAKTGTKHSAATKAKMSATRTGRKIPAMRRHMIGNKFALGYRHTEETKAAMSKKRKGIRHSRTNPYQEVLL